MMDPTHAMDERAYASAIRELESLAGAPSGTPEGDRAQVLVAYVEAYEAHHAHEEADRG